MDCKNILGGVLLVSGTSIGAGMLALPVDTAELGFFNASIIFLLCWFFMTMSAFYMLEANLQFKNENLNLGSMAEYSLGIYGKVMAWIAYIILLYALTAAYTTGTSSWIIKHLKYINIELSFNITACILSLLLALTAYTGTRGLDYVNRLFAITLYIGLAALFLIILPETKTEYIYSDNHIFNISSIPLIITSFGFHIVIPSLTIYFARNIKKLNFVILLGGTIPLIIYLLWEYAILGSMPRTGEHSLAMIGNNGASPTVGITNYLNAALNNSLISKISSTISVLAVVTSVIGVTMSLYDFLADTFKITEKCPKKYFGLSCLVFIPPLIFVIKYPEAFIFALHFAGIFVATLLGLLPILMVYSNRYILKLENNYRVFGGKPMIFISFLFFASVIIIETLNQVGMI